jgi:hypothetical protein
MVRTQQESVLHSGMAACRVGNPGGSKLRLVKPRSVLSAATSRWRATGTVLGGAMGVGTLDAIRSRVDQN